MQQTDQSTPPPEQQGQPHYLPPPYFEPPSVKQEKAAEDAYWARRIENLKRAHENINKNMDIEYQKTLKEVNELFEWAEKENIAAKLPPCQEEKAKVISIPCFKASFAKRSFIHI